MATAGRGRKGVLTQAQRRERRRERNRAYYLKTRGLVKHENAHETVGSSAPIGADSDTVAQPHALSSVVSEPSSPVPSMPKTPMEIKQSWIDAFELANQTVQLQHT
ncbi:hypothetical protein SPRG_21009 [Saprolegnia parasitica CBS 223.65]|uniref:Uncharacterized protein n=1 Tax=Saprolegnia parasitica (strain CBS 223.65) TaxID=695850 RepID=A0A067BZ99_SAPPC|nr:hypothetical protein SPRG_21009 [Saprolegnia parasitica CBS 223.65]KDO23849.1 hypothetical protein SPRG_21009 [Saprolegnia parasitica CBS 223.65]|eukprot:XP_012205507.1 hypothetical protein SPRG_21009 [Saprolegnia parasitica CBS 223.65]